MTDTHSHAKVSAVKGKAKKAQSIHKNMYPKAKPCIPKAHLGLPENDEEYTEEICVEKEHFPFKDGEDTYTTTTSTKRYKINSAPSHFVRTVTRLHKTVFIETGFGEPGEVESDISSIVLNNVGNAMDISHPGTPERTPEKKTAPYISTREGRFKAIAKVFNEHCSSRNVKATTPTASGSRAANHSTPVANHTHSCTSAASQSPVMLAKKPIGPSASQVITIPDTDDEVL